MGKELWPHAVTVTGWKASEVGTLAVWKLLEQPAITGSEVLPYLMVINGKVFSLSL